MRISTVRMIDPDAPGERPWSLAESTFDGGLPT